MAGGEHEKKMDDEESNHVDTHKEKDVDTLVVSAFLFVSIRSLVVRALLSNYFQKSSILI